MLKAWGGSLSAKFIVFAVALELILMVGGLYTANWYLVDQRTQGSLYVLQSQVDLIAKQLELDQSKSSTSRFDAVPLNTLFSFQIVSEGGRIDYDSPDQTRIGKQLLAPHPFFIRAKKSGTVSGLEEFNTLQTNEPFFGAYRKSESHLVLGAISARSIKNEVYRTLEKLLFFDLLFAGLSILLILYFSNRMIQPAIQLTEPSENPQYFETCFLGLGILLVVGSLAVLYSGASFVRARAQKPDPFSASYATVTPTPTPEPSPTPTPTPTPKRPKPTPKPDVVRMREKSYLLQPKANTVFNKTDVSNKPFSLTFRFEVEPRHTPCTFQLELDQRSILVKKLKGSPTGSYELKILLKKPGKYTWQIMTSNSKSEKRDLTVKP